MKKVLIIGSGQIGSRHLQALRSVNLPLSIGVIDANPQSLKTAKERYDSLPNGKFEHKLNYSNKIQKSFGPMDLAIIATSSDVRSKVVIELLKSVKVKYLILEKILFNNKSDYETIGKLLRKSKTTTWVNCPMRMVPTYQNIEKYFKNKRISYLVTGSQFGLITNAIHYLDHAAYLSATTEFQTNTAGLDPKPVPSKRKGFLEFNGTLTANFKNGSNVSLTCYPDGNAPVVIEISSDDTKYIGRESEGKAWLSRAENNWQWEELEAPIPYQSQLTNVLVEKILKTGKCNLVSYDESKKIHLNMLEPLLIFLNNNSKKKYTAHPFT